MDIKDVFATEFVKVKKLKYKGILNTYKKLEMEIDTKYQMYKKANELLEDEEVQAMVDMLSEETRIKDVVDMKKEIMKTNKKIWKTLEVASQLENKITKQGTILEDMFKFQDSNVVVASLQILSRQSDLLRDEISKLKVDKEDKASDTIKIEWT